MGISLYTGLPLLVAIVSPGLGLYVLARNPYLREGRALFLTMALYGVLGLSYFALANAPDGGRPPLRFTGHGRDHTRLWVDVVSNLLSTLLPRTLLASGTPSSILDCSHHYGYHMWNNGRRCHADRYRLWALHDFVGTHGGHGLYSPGHRYGHYRFEGMVGIA